MNNSGVEEEKEQNMDFHNPLEFLTSNTDKNPQYWFEQYAVWTQKTPSNQIARANGENSKDMKAKLVHFRGMVSNQLNPEYFYSQFVTDNFKNDGKIHSGLYCEQVNLPSNETILHNNDKTKTLQRFPMILVKTPNETQWRKEESNQDCKNDDSPSKLIAKFYSNENSLKVCDLVDIYGIWYPGTTDMNEKKEKENESKRDNSNDNYSDMCNNDNGSFLNDLPCIHVLYWKKVENNFIDSIPYPSDKLNFEKFDKIFENLRENVNEIRESLIKYIASYFGNDTLVATYILLNMISKVVTRKHGVIIGNFSVNLTGYSKLNTNIDEEVKKIHQLYSELMPYVMKIDISVESMNESRFVPIKNHDTNELRLNDKNNLQLVKGTSLILNQLALKTGKLESNGVLNIQALSQLIENQIVNYDFEFSQIPFEADCSIVLLSEKQAIKELKCSTNVRVLHCDSSIKEEENDNDNDNDKDNSNDNNQGNGSGKIKACENELKEWRNYICVARMILDKFSLPQSVCEMVQTDFVNLRQRDSKATDDDLHYRLTLLRLLNASYLKKETDESVFKDMQKLEIERNVRCAQQPKK